jgi:hypothetical protein
MAPQQPPCPLATVLRLKPPSPFCHPERSRGTCGAPVPVPQAQGCSLPLSLPLLFHPIFDGAKPRDPRTFPGNALGAYWAWMVTVTGMVCGGMQEFESQAW